MSDEWQDDSPSSLGGAAPSWPTQPPPTAPSSPLSPPPPGGDLPVYGEPPPPPATPRSGTVGRVVALVAAAMVVVFGGVFAYSSLTAADGASSPEGAVDDFFGAINNEDAIGVLEALPPGERAALREPLTNVVAELQRLGVLGDFKLDDVPGAYFEVDGLQYRTDPIDNTLVRVQVVGGSITSNVVGSDLPIGSLTEELMGSDTTRADLNSGPTTSYFKDSPFTLVTVKEGGGWHVSLAYSIAEAIRGDSGGSLSQIGQGPAPVGADSPEGAVRALVDAGVNMDPEAAIAMLPPDEMRALYDYSPLLLSGYDPAQLRDDGFQIKVNDLQLSTEGDGDVRRVRVESWDVEMGDSDLTVHTVWDGQCSTTTFSSDSDYYSRFGDLTTSLGNQDQHYCRGDDPASVNGGIADLPALGDAQLAVTVVREDGRWYVSPTRTILDSVVEVLHSLTADDLRSWVDAMRTASEQSFQTVGGAVDGSGGYDPSTDPYLACDHVYDGIAPDASDQQWQQADDAYQACVDSMSPTTTVYGNTTVPSTTPAAPSTTVPSATSVPTSTSTTAPQTPGTGSLGST